MGYRVEVGGPVRPALVSLRVGTEGSPAVEAALGVALPRPVGFASRNGSVTVFGLGPDEWLVRVPPDEEEHWLERLEAAVAGSFGAAVVVSDAWSVFTVTGPDTLDVLAQSTGVDVHPSVFPAGRAVRAGFAGITALLHRLDDRPSFDVYVDASFARYAGRWIESAIGGGRTIHSSSADDKGAIHTGEV